MFRSRFCLYALFILVFPCLSGAQEASPGPQDSRVEEKHALELLDSIANSISILKSFENRAHLTSSVADLLWAKDEKRARSLFDAATKDINIGLAGLDPDSPQIENSVAQIQQQRREILERMAKRDPEMALSFLRATRMPPPFDSFARGHYESESNIELHLAGLIAGKNPERALETARAALKKGVTPALTSLLFQMVAKNQGVAQTLHKEIVDRLKSLDLPRNHEAANMAANLLTSFYPPQANEETYKDLADIVAKTLLSVGLTGPGRNSLAQSFHSQLPSIMPQFEKYAPAHVPALRRWSENVKRRSDPGTWVYQEVNEIAQRGTVDDVLAHAEKVGPEFQSHIYEQAAWKAVGNGDADRARRIILEFVSDPTRQRQMLEQVDNQLISRLIGENKIVEVRQMLIKIRSVEQRIQTLVWLAGNLAANNERKQALGVLEEASAMVDELPPGSRKLSSQLQLAQSYSALDSPQSMALLQSIISQMNQLIAAAVVLDGVENTYLKDGEWTKRNYSNVSNLVNSLTLNLGAIARQDIAEALALSNQLERTEIRLMAHLEIAQAVLGGGSPNFRRIGRRTYVTTR